MAVNSAYVIVLNDKAHTIGGFICERAELNWSSHRYLENSGGIAIARISMARNAARYGWTAWIDAERQRAWIPLYWPALVMLYVTVCHIRVFAHRIERDLCRCCGYSVSPETKVCSECGSHLRPQTWRCGSLLRVGWVMVAIGLLMIGVTSAWQVRWDIGSRTQVQLAEQRVALVRHVPVDFPNDHRRLEVDRGLTLVPSASSPLLPVIEELAPGFYQAWLPMYFLPSGGILLLFWVCRRNMV
jgi:hypothetical protein